LDSEVMSRDCPAAFFYGCISVPFPVTGFPFPCAVSLCGHAPGACARRLWVLRGLDTFTTGRFLKESGKVAEQTCSVTFPEARRKGRCGGSAHNGAVMGTTAGRSRDCDGRRP